MLAFITIIVSLLLVLMYAVDALAIPLFLIFMILELCGVIAWGWLIVCIPLIVWGVAILFTIVACSIQAVKEKI